MLFKFWVAVYSTEFDKSLILPPQPKKQNFQTVTAALLGGVFVLAARGGTVEASFG